MFNLYEVQDDEGTTSYLQIWAPPGPCCGQEGSGAIRYMAREMTMREVLRTRAIALS